MHPSVAVAMKFTARPIRAIFSGTSAFSLTTLPTVGYADVLPVFATRADALIGLVIDFYSGACPIDSVNSSRA
jgi:hypothetical protein